MSFCGEDVRIWVFPSQRVKKKEKQLLRLRYFLTEKLWWNNKVLTAPICSVKKCPFMYLSVTRPRCQQRVTSVVVNTETFSRKNVWSPCLTAHKHGDWQLFIWTGQKSLSQTAGAYLDICWWKIWSQWGWTTLCNELRKKHFFYEPWAIRCKNWRAKTRWAIHHHSYCLVAQRFRGHHPRVKLGVFNFRTVVQTSSQASMGFTLFHTKTLLRDSLIQPNI